MWQRQRDEADEEGRIWVGRTRRRLSWVFLHNRQIHHEDTEKACGGMLGVGMLGVGCWVLGVGYWVLGVGCWDVGMNWARLGTDHLRRDFRIRRLVVAHHRGRLHRRLRLDPRHSFLDC